MKRQLTSTEKVLITILIAVVIVVLPFVFVISPMLAANEAALSNTAALEQEKEAIITQSQSLAALQSSFDEALGEFKQNADMIPSTEKSYDIHYFVSDICTSAGVSLDGLSIGDYIPVKTSDAEGNEVESALSCASVDMLVRGDFGGVLKVLDAFEQCSYTKVVAFNAPVLDQNAAQAGAGDTAELAVDASNASEADAETAPAEASEAPMEPSTIRVDIYGINLPVSDVEALLGE